MHSEGSSSWQCIQARCKITPPTYTRGKAFYSHDSGETWIEIPDTTFMFEIWGWAPPPEPPPEPEISNFAVQDQIYFEEGTGLKIVVTTDRPCHLYMRWTLTEPEVHSKVLYRRGIAMHTDKRFCFVTYHENEQEQQGDTLIHTFIKPGWPVCQTRYFYFLGTRAGEQLPSTSALFKKHHLKEPVATLAPTGDGDLIQLEATGEPQWQMVLNKDSTWYPPDAVYIYGHWEGNYVYKPWYPSVWKWDLYTFQNLPERTPPIAKLTINAFIGGNAYAAGLFVLALKTHGELYNSDIEECAASGEWESHSRENNPYTGLPWTHQEINTVQAGLAMVAGTSPGGFGMCDKIYLSYSWEYAP